MGTPPAQVDCALATCRQELEVSAIQSQGRPSRGMTWCLGAIVSAGLLVSQTAVTAVAKSKPRAPRVRLAYALSLRLSEMFELTAKRGSLVVQNERELTIFTGVPTRLWLVNRGTTKAPRYETQRVGTSSAGTLTVPGTLAYTGTGYSIGGPVACKVDFTSTIPGSKNATAQVLLARNRFLRLSATSGAEVIRHSVGCGTDVFAPSGKGPINSPVDNDGAALGTRLGMISSKLIRFGRSFTLSQIDNPGNDKDLFLHYNVGGVGFEESWYYNWRLTFKPVTARR